MNKSRIRAKYRLIVALALVASGLAGCSFTQQRPQNSRLLKVISGQMVFVDTGVWSPDSKMVAVGGGMSPLRVWNIASVNQVASIPLATVREGIAWSPDGKYLAMAVSQPSDKFQVWDVAGEKLIFKDNPGVGTVGADGVAWSPDGKTLAVVVGGGSNDKGTVDYAELLLYDTSNWKQTRSFTYGVDYLGPIAWAPDGHRIAIESTTSDLEKTELIVWDTSSNQTSSVGRVENGNIYGLYWSPNGKQIAVAANDTEVVLFDVDSSSIVKTFNQKSTIESFSLSPNGEKLATGESDIDHNVVTVWDVKSEKVLYKLDHLNPTLKGIKWSPDGDYLATITVLDNALWIWDAK